MAESGCLRDAHVQTLNVANKTEVGGTLDVTGALTASGDPFVEKTRAVAVINSAVTAVNGDVLVISHAAPGAITLPAAKAGSKIRLLQKITNTTAYTITCPGAAGARYDVLSAITLEDKAADTANTFGDVPVANDNTLTITKGGIGSHLEFISNGTTYFVMGHLSAGSGDPPSAAFTTV